MMNQPSQTPNPEKIKQTASRLRDICTMFDAQILILDELIAQVEAENRNHPLNYTKKMKGKALLNKKMQ